MAEERAHMLMKNNPNITLLKWKVSAIDGKLRVVDDNEKICHDKDKWSMDMSSFHNKTSIPRIWYKGKYIGGYRDFEDALRRENMY